MFYFGKISIEVEKKGNLLLDHDDLPIMTKIGGTQLIPYKTLLLTRSSFA